jgi:hypothetical protein
MWSSATSVFAEPSLVRQASGYLPDLLPLITLLTKLTVSERPERVAIDLIDRQVVFVRVGGDRYAAELDGRRLPIRIERHKKDISEAGILHEWEPEMSEGDTANIDTILLCFANGAAPTPLPQGVRIEAMDNWGHFRQNTFLTISITIAENGVVEINENIQEQDGSYY